MSLVRWLVALATAATVASATTVRRAAAKVQVGELFDDLLFHGNPTCRLAKRLHDNAPWLSQAHLRNYTVPTLRELRETMLSGAFVFNASLRRCVGDKLGIPRGLGPRGLCVQGFPGSSMLFDQYALEVVLLTRWLQEAPICSEGSCGARMVVVPSLLFHHTAAFGRSWSWLGGGCRVAQRASQYWARVAARYFTPGGPLIVVAESYAYDTKVVFEVLVALSKMPAEFRARVVILTTMSNQQSSFRRISGFALPWQSGADAELQRRALLQQELTRLQKLGDVPGAALVRARALLSSAPLMLTVPRPVGVFQHGVSWFTPSAGFTPSPRPVRLFWDADHRRNGGKNNAHTKSNVRERIAHALVAAKAKCSKDRSRCVLCAPHSPGCAAMRPTVFGDTARSAVCIEPPGDVLGRSHVYVAIVTGCVPVLVEGGHPAYPEGGPTWWPWRAAQEAPGGLPAAASPLRGLTLDYSAFSLLPDGGGSNDSDAAARLVSESASLAADEGRLSRMRAELARVAPLFVYARQRPRAGEPEDAFERLRKTLARVLL
jgi:hypothetical protein